MRYAENMCLSFGSRILTSVFFTKLSQCILLQKSYVCTVQDTKEVVVLSQKIFRIFFLG
jgi:hypothetical protein